MKLRFYGIIVITLLTVVLLTGCGSSQSGTENEPTTSNAATDKEIVITYSVTKTNQIGDGLFMAVAPSGSIYLMLDMTIENHGYDVFSTSVFFFKVVVNNKKYGYISSESIENQLRSADIPNNGSINGNLVFQIPADADSFDIEYKDAQLYNMRWVKQ